MSEPLGYGDTLADLEAAIGTTFAVEDTGGGHLVFQARLDDGSWIVASDGDSGIIPLARRRELEAAGTTVGWLINVCPDDGDGGPDTGTTLASVSHETADADGLAPLVHLAVAAVRDNAHHNYHRGGGHLVTYGVRHH